MSYLFLAVSIIFMVAGQIILKYGIQSSTLSLSLISIVKTAFSPMVFLGIVLYCISAIFWMFVLKKFALSVAYPTGAVSYIIILFASAVILNEPITLLKIMGVLLIIGGVLLLHL